MVTVSMFMFSRDSPSFMMEPLPKSFSIFVNATSSAFIFSSWSWFGLTGAFDAAFAAILFLLFCI